MSTKEANLAQAFLAKETFGASDGNCALSSNEPSGGCQTADQPQRVDKVPPTK